MSASTPEKPANDGMSEQLRAERAAQALLLNDHASKRLGMTLEMVAPAYLDDVLTAVANVQSQGRRTGLYDVVITNQHNERIALFRGRSYRLGRTLFDEVEGPVVEPE